MAKEFDLMIPIRGVYEVAVKVHDLKRAEAFYREVLGLQFGLRDERRNWVFLRAGDSAGMVVLQEDRGEWPRQHFAFRVEDSELEGAAALLRQKGISVTSPVFHEWMPGRSVYFTDPDGHALELFAPNDWKIREVQGETQLRSEAGCQRRSSSDPSLRETAEVKLTDPGGQEQGEREEDLPGTPSRSPCAERAERVNFTSTTCGEGESTFNRR